MCFTLLEIWVQTIFNEFADQNFIHELSFNVENEAKLSWNRIELKHKIFQLCINFEHKTLLKKCLLWNDCAMMRAFGMYFGSFIVKKLNSQWKYAISQRYHPQNFNWRRIKRILKDKSWLIKPKKVCLYCFYVDFIEFTDKRFYDLINTEYLGVMAW